MAPFDVHLIELPGAKNTKQVYEDLKKAGVDTLWDDRKVGAGEKFADADLIGIPVRAVVSGKTGSKIEFKRRDYDKVEVLTFEELVKRL
jgi:prolyl-tRNA synthetase